MGTGCRRHGAGGSAGAKELTLLQSSKNGFVPRTIASEWRGTMAQQKTGDHISSRDEPNRWLQDTSGSIIGRATTNHSMDQSQRSEIDSLVTPSRAVGQSRRGSCCTHLRNQRPSGTSGRAHRHCGGSAAVLFRIREGVSPARSVLTSAL